MDQWSLTPLITIPLITLKGIYSRIQEGSIVF